MIPGPQLYMTRNAVLSYQALFGGGFETIRRRLTVKLLNDARPDPVHGGCFLLDMGEMTLEDSHAVLRVYTILDAPLLIVTKVELAELAA